MNNTLTYPSLQKAIISIKFPRINLRFFWILSFLLIGALLVFYIFQVTAFITAGYQVQNYQGKINDLERQNKFLEIGSVRINSLENIERRAQELGFVKINKINYIQALEYLAVTKE